jgi:RNA polymerase sigma factor (sigma-70 family)
MSKSAEHEFAEVVFEKLILENIPEEQSPYFVPPEDDRDGTAGRMSSRLKWHINNSLSPRQKQVIKLLLEGKTEREIAAILGIAQQVVHIYKWRAIKRLRSKL